MQVQHRVRRIAGAAIAVAAIATATPAASADPTYELVSVARHGPRTGAVRATMSADGRLVVMASQIPLTGSADRPGTHLYLRNRARSTTVQVDVNSEGISAHGSNDNGVVAGRARIVAFPSQSTDLDPRFPSFSYTQVYVRDLAAGTTTLVSVSLTGTPANGSTFVTSMSDDGRFVGMVSDASDLVAGDTNGKADTFLLDRDTGVISRVSVTEAGAQGQDASSTPILSPDGRSVAYFTYSPILAGSEIARSGPAIVWVDLVSGHRERIDVSTSGAPADDQSGAMDVANRGRVVFSSYGRNLIDGHRPPGDNHLYVRDIGTGTTRLVDRMSTGVPSPMGGIEPSITADGRGVWFTSYESLVPGQPPGLYRRDTTTGTTSFVDANACHGTVSEDGSTAMFISGAQLVPTDTNDDIDVYVRPGTA